MTEPLGDIRVVPLTREGRSHPSVTTSQNDRAGLTLRPAQLSGHVARLQLRPDAALPEPYRRPAPRAMLSGNPSRTVVHSEDTPKAWGASSRVTHCMLSPCSPIVSYACSLAAKAWPSAPSFRHRYNGRHNAASLAYEVVS